MTLVSETPAAAVDLPAQRGPAVDRPSRRARAEFSAEQLVSSGLWTLTGLVLIEWSQRIYTSVTVYPAVALGVVTLGLSGLLLVVAAWTEAGRRRLGGGRLPWVVTGLVVAGFLLWAGLQITQTPGYGTDELAFDQYAAQLAAHGHNPYLTSMQPSFDLFHVDPNGYTFRLDGTPVTALSYPALSFLVYLPALLIGWSTQLANVMNAAAWAVTIVLMVALCPRRLRGAALVLGSFAVYTSYALGGITDALFQPLLLLGVWRWDDATERGWRSWRSPLLLGLACSVKQTPWPVTIVLAVAVACELASLHPPRVALRRMARWAALVLLPLVVTNAPYLLASPGAWLRGILTPFQGDTVPAGQGAVSLSVFMHLGGGSLRLIALSSSLALVVVVLATVAYYPRLKRIVVLLPVLPLFLATRSFGSYFVALIPALMVSALTVRDAPTGTTEWLARFRFARFRRVVVVGGLVAVIGVLIVGFATPAPLRVSVTGVHTSGQLATVDEITLDVTNATGRTITPAYTLNEGGTLTAFWTQRSGPGVLAPHSKASVTIVSPNFPSTPVLSGGFQVVAFSETPATISHSSAYVPNAYHLAITPGAVDTSVPVGQPVTFTATLLDRLDRPVHVGSVPVYLGQAIYAQDGIELGTAIINGSEPGATPVEALTDGLGVAHFSVTGTTVTSDPVSLEANLVNATGLFPYGYSQILQVRFR